MVYLILDGIEITSLEKLEETIVDFPEESKIALRLVFEDAAKKIKE